MAGAAYAGMGLVCAMAALSAIVKGVVEEVSSRVQEPIKPPEGKGWPRQGQSRQRQWQMGATRGRK